MGENNHPGHSGEEDYYSQPPYSPPRSKIVSPPPRQSGQRLLPIFIVITTILLVLVIVFGVVIVRLETTPSPNSHLPLTPTTTAITPPTATIVATTAPTPTNPAPTATPTNPAPTPTPTPCPNPCVVYQENGSDGWQGWSLTPDWRIVENNKLLINDGSAGSQSGPSAIPPYSLPQGIQNFAIEVGITVPQGLSGGPGWTGYFSITACGSTTNNGWQGYEGLIGYNRVPWSKADILTNQDQLAQTDFSPNTTLNTYRLEVKGNVVSLFVNGAPIAQGTDNKFLPCGSQIGIISPSEVIHVSSFKVILL